ncbi:MAG TPA: hypothetical protein VK327_14435 [Candidatus Paceibacterota bacterium]|nr:hypothetical protein [Candidatus Paceibacterota bacterium]
MKRNINKIEQIIKAWETLAPDQSFGGMTLAQFKTLVQPAFDLKEQKSQLDNQWTENTRRLADISRNGMDAALLVVNSVKGNPAHGENSPLYAAMGYVRKSERQSGLTRKILRATVAPQILKAAA